VCSAGEVSAGEVFDRVDLRPYSGAACWPLDRRGDETARSHSCSAGDRHHHDVDDHNRAIHGSAAGDGLDHTIRYPHDRNNGDGCAHYCLASDGPLDQSHTRDRADDYGARHGCVDHGVGARSDGSYDETSEERERRKEPGQERPLMRGLIYVRGHGGEAITDAVPGEVLADASAARGAELGGVR